MLGFSRSECHRVAKVLQAYLDGEAPVPTAAFVAAHLEVCRMCGLEASTYLAIRTAIAVGAPAGPAPDPGAVDRLRRFGDGLGGTER
ncbi:MAG TPA: zf-HC2 domain-containing protein [Actinotalea sp.]|nr:zf-HC2 domain-containing protein [Actinotalea sp.]